MIRVAMTETELREQDRQSIDAFLDALWMERGLRAIVRIALSHVTASGRRSDVGSGQGAGWEGVDGSRYALWRPLH
jgi:hypothetical protein